MDNVLVFFAQLVGIFALVGVLVLIGCTAYNVIEATQELWAAPLTCELPK